MMHRVETWQNRIKGFFEDKEAVPAAKYDIDKDAQIAHANIAIASSNIIGKMPVTVYNGISCHKRSQTSSSPSS